MLSTVLHLKELAADLISVAQGYQPFGYFHIMAEERLTSFDSLQQKSNLDHHWYKRIGVLLRAIHQRLLGSMTSSHGVLSYQSTLQRILQRPFRLSRNSGQTLQLVHKMLYGMAPETCRLLHTLLLGCQHCTMGASMQIEAAI